jgi:hypothetical protein
MAICYCVAPEPGRNRRQPQSSTAAASKASTAVSSRVRGTNPSEELHVYYAQHELHDEAGGGSQKTSFVAVDWLDGLLQPVIYLRKPGFSDTARGLHYTRIGTRYCQLGRVSGAPAPGTAAACFLPVRQGKDGQKKNPGSKDAGMAEEPAQRHRVFDS